MISSRLSFEVNIHPFINEVMHNNWNFGYNLPYISSGFWPKLWPPIDGPDRSSPQSKTCKNPPPTISVTFHRWPPLPHKIFFQRDARCWLGPPRRGKRAGQSSKSFWLAHSVFRRTRVRINGPYAGTAVGERDRRVNGEVRHVTPALSEPNTFSRWEVTGCRRSPDFLDLCDSGGWQRAEKGRGGPTRKWPQMECFKL